MSDDPDHNRNERVAPETKDSMVIGNHGPQDRGESGEGGSGGLRDAFARGKESIRVTVSNEQNLAVDEARIAGVAERTAAEEGAVGEISVLLVGPDRMAELNRRFMRAEGPTDVLAFPVDGLVTEASDTPVVIGEVVICPEVAQGQAGDKLAAELDLLTAHGVLHLLGFDHEDEPGAEKMRARELRVSGRAGAQAE